MAQLAGRTESVLVLELGMHYWYFWFSSKYSVECGKEHERV